MGQMAQTFVASGCTRTEGCRGWFLALCGNRAPTVLVLLQMMLFCSMFSVIGFVRVPSAAAQVSESKPVFDTVIIRNRAPAAADEQAKQANGPGEEKSAKAVPGPTDAQDGPPAEKGQAGAEAAGDHADGVGVAGGTKHNGRDKGPAVAEVREARVLLEGGKTRFQLSMSAGVRAEIFTLANPYRVVIDLPDVAFQLANGIGQKGGGLISAFRYGLFAEKKGRVVIDATGPVRIDGAKMTTLDRGRAVNLELELVTITESEFGAGTGAASNAAAAPVQPSSRPAIFDDPMGSPSEEKKPLVLIDPGHGGIDPGAVGIDNLLEKSVVLEVAKRIERRLKSTGRYRVAMTRDRDVFLSLDQRVNVSGELGADLFVSLHADSLASKVFATQVRGATVYTLSERASDEQARLMAEKENASDQAAGIDSGALGVESEEVRNILFDLMKRETSNFSTDFSNLLVARLKQSVSVSRDPQRSAAFRVLKQTYAPSVLIELGYLSNDADAKLMRQAEWQGKVAQSIVAAIDVFFDKRTARTGP